MKNIPFLLLYILFFISCEESSNEIISLNDGWQFSETENPNWRSASVLGTIQADLLRLGEIPIHF